jgi:NADH-quinone oxidoreductase subunit E
MLRGAEDLKEVCRRKIHPEPHHLSVDGDFSWEEVECLGACVNAPMVQIWKDTYEDLTPETFEIVLDAIAAGRQPKPGPQNGRQFSAPEGGPTTLLDAILYDARASSKDMEPSTPAADLPPSNAGKPQSAALVSSPGARSPSPEKTTEAEASRKKMNMRARASRGPGSASDAEGREN